MVITKPAVLKADPLLSMCQPPILGTRRPAQRASPISPTAVAALLLLNRCSATPGKRGEHSYSLQGRIPAHSIATKRVALTSGDRSEVLLVHLRLRDLGESGRRCQGEQG
jgi:hypothetical protein